MAGRNPNVLVIGGCYADIAIQCNEFPTPEKIVSGSGFSCTASGNGLNQAIEAALCGCEVYLIASVGKDCMGCMIKDTLRTSKVNCDFIYEAEAITTGVFCTMVNHNGENISCKSEGANKALGADHIEAARIEQAVSDADLCLIDGKMEASAITAAINTSQLYQTRSVIYTDMKLEQVNEKKDSMPIEFFSADIFVTEMALNPVLAESPSANVHEAKLVAADLVARGVKYVVIMMGRKGSLVVSRDGTIHLPAFEVDFADENCCKDAFMGALAASYAVGDTIKDAVRFAAAAEAIAWSRFGCHDSLPTRAEIIELLQRQS